MNAGRNDIDDIHAFYTALVKRNASLIRWLCLRQADGDQALCDDLVQEVLLALWLHLGSTYCLVDDGAIHQRIY